MASEVVCGERRQRQATTTTKQEHKSTYELTDTTATLLRRSKRHTKSGSDVLETRTDNATTTTKRQQGETQNDTY